MEFSIKSRSPEKQRSACVVVGVFDSRKLTPPAAVLDKAANGYIASIASRGDMDGKAGSTLLLQKVPGTLCDRVLLVGLGKEKEFHEKEFGNAIRATLKALNETGTTDAAIYLFDEWDANLDAANREAADALVEQLARRARLHPTSSGL